MATSTPPTMCDKLIRSFKESVLPLQFFDKHQAVTPKASLHLLYPLATITYVLVLGAFVTLFVIESTKSLTVKETKISRVPTGPDCTALGVWSNRAPALSTYTPYKAHGFEAYIDASLTSQQCTNETAGVCENWADRYVGTGSCCLAPSSSNQSNCYQPMSDLPSSSLRYCGGANEVNISSHWYLRNGMKASMYAITVEGSKEKSFLDVTDHIVSEQANQVYNPSSEYAVVRGPHKNGTVTNGNENIAAHDKLYKNSLASTRSQLVLSTCALMDTSGSFDCISNFGSEALGGDGGGWDEHGSFLGNDRYAKDFLDRELVKRGGEEDLLLSRADFITKCNAATQEICESMDTECGPFACIEEHVYSPSWFEAVGIAFANGQLAAAILFLASSLLAQRISPYKGTKLTLNEGVLVESEQAKAEASEEAAPSTADVAAAAVPNTATYTSAVEMPSQKESV